MSYRGGNRHRHRDRGYNSKGNRHHPNSSPSGKRQKTKENIDESSAVIQAFLGFQKELDTRNDRFERIVKLSRDITIESKRIIFLLQRVAGSEKKESLLKEAASKIDQLHQSKFISLARELEGQDYFQFLRAFSPGLQEYIEAIIFYHYLCSESLVDVVTLQSHLAFSGTPGHETFRHLSDDITHASIQAATERLTDLSAEDKVCGGGKEASDKPGPAPTGNESQSPAAATQEDKVSERVTVPIPPNEFMLGMADFTGELMRMAINSVGAGDLDMPAVVTGMMRFIHDAFTTFNNVPRELRHKTRVLSQSLQKVERACYTLQVRGSEIPKHMLADVFNSSHAASQDTFTADDTDDINYESSLSFLSHVLPPLSA